jgi:hypothetical protein
MSERETVVELHLRDGGVQRTQQLELDGHHAGVLASASRRRPSRSPCGSSCACAAHTTPSGTATEKLRIVTLGLARRDREWSLNDGQIPNPSVVRVAPGTRYHRVEGNRRASRNGPAQSEKRRRRRRKVMRSDPARWMVYCAGGLVRVHWNAEGEAADGGLL